jgi:hypothetical protein
MNCSNNDHIFNIFLYFHIVYFSVNNIFHLLLNLIENNSETLMREFTRVIYQDINEE